MVRDALVSGRTLQSILISKFSLEEPRIREIEDLAAKKKGAVSRPLVATFSTP